MLSLCDPTASGKATRPISFELSFYLYYNPELFTKLYFKRSQKLIPKISIFSKGSSVYEKPGCELHLGV